MLQTLFPGDVADMNHAFDAVTEVDEGSKIAQVRDGAFHDGSRGESLLCVRPWITQRLFQSQRNPMLSQVYAQNHDVHRLADLHHVAGFADLLSPGHFGDVDQPVHTGIQLNERAEIRKAGYNSVDAISNLILTARY